MKITRRSLSDAALGAAVLAPLAAWRLASEASGLDGLGRAAGVLGLSCMLLAAFVSARVPGFDVRFGGLTRLWKLHHLLGAAAFLLLMAHPLLLAFAAARASLGAAAAVLLPPRSARAAWAGWGALALMTVFLAPTFGFFGRPEYQRWKALHALSGAAMVLGLSHGAAGGRLAAVWAACGGLALLAFVWRLFAAPRVARRSFTVARRDAVARGIVELTLAADGAPLEHRAGQFVYLTPLAAGLDAGRGEEHPYTVSSAPGEPALRIAVKDLGDASRALQSVPVGSKALVEGPYGDFFPADAALGRELWIAGGVGITPFLSRVRALQGGPVDIHLIYCVQDETRAHFAAELDAAAARIPGFRFWRHYFSSEGPLTEAFIRARCPDLAGREIFLCGPPPLVAAARDAARGAGAPAARVHAEDFDWL